MIKAWFDRGAPLGDSDKTAKVPPIEKIEAPVSATLTIPYFPKGHAFHAPHDVVCYKVSLGQSEKKQLVAFDALPAIPKRVVAVWAYRLSAAQAAPLADEFPCDQFPGVPGALGATAFSDAALVGVWQGGAGPVRLPAGTGAAIAPDDSLVLRIYYHPTSGTGQEVTTVNLYFAAAPVAEARLLSLVDNDFVVPADTAEYQHTATFTAPGPGRLFGVAPYLGPRGRSLHLEAGGTTALDLAKWTPEWQAVYWFDGAPLTVSAGTTFTLRCNWVNPGNVNPLNPGYGLTDEVCAASLYWLDN